MRIRLAITEADGIGWLVQLLGCDNPKARQHAEGALVKLSIENANRVMIIKKLVEMLRGREETGDASDSGTAAQEQAAAALANLARDSADNRKSIVQADGIPSLLLLLDDARRSSLKAKENAAEAITQLARNSRENQAVIIKAGGIARLTGVLVGVDKDTFASAQAASTQYALWTIAAAAINEMSSPSPSP